MSAALYAPWPAQARRTWGGGAIALVIAGYFASSFPVIIGTVIWAAASGAFAGADPLAAEAALQNATLPVVMPLLLAQFVLWTAMTLVWASVFERRGPASYGLAINLALAPRYLLGLVLGAGLLAAIGVMSALLGGGAGGLEASPIDADVSPQALTEALARPGVAMALTFAALVFLIQGGAEEVVFRGWLMSTLAARWGVRAGVIVSSLAFMVLHAHVFVSGLWFGIAALAGVGMMGVVFALLALFTRSVWEAAAAHGAFNAVAVTAPTAAVLASDPELDVQAAFARVFESATGMAGPDAVSVSVETWAQALAAGVIAALLAVLIVRLKRTARPWREDAPSEEPAG